MAEGRVVEVLVDPSEPAPPDEVGDALGDC